MKRWTAMLLVLSHCASAFAMGGARLKDIANIGGLRDIELIGYGLVIGLDGTGDKAGTSPTTQSMVTMLKRMGVAVNPVELNSNNSAAVMVTARIPVFTPAGSRVDATVSSLSNAVSLNGGTLLVTPLIAGDGKTYAAAQGKIAVDQPLEAKTAPKRKASGTVGLLAGGVTLEKEFQAAGLFSSNAVLIELKMPDFVTSERVTQAVRSAFETRVTAIDPVRINVDIPQDFLGDPVGFIARLGSLTVDPDETAKVVINEHTGTVVSGSNIRISAVSISHGSFKVDIGGGSQDLAVPDSTTVTTLVSMLSNMGATPWDIAVIFKTLKRVGALQAELVVM